MSRAQQNTTTYTYTNTVPVGYTSKPSSIQPPPPLTTPQQSAPLPAIYILNLPKPTTPPNNRFIPLVPLPLPPMPLMEVPIPILLEEELLTMPLAEVLIPMVPELTGRVESTRPLLRRSQLRAESSIFPSRRNTLSMNKSKRFTKSQSRLRSLSTRRSSETKESPMREPSLTTMPLKLKSSTSEEKSKKP